LPPTKWHAASEFPGIILDSPLCTEPVALGSVASDLFARWGKPELMVSVNATFERSRRRRSTSVPSSRGSPSPAKAYATPAVFSQSAPTIQLSQTPVVFAASQSLSQPLFSAATPSWDRSQQQQSQSMAKKKRKSGF
jgi:hypothetical protein